MSKAEQLDEHREKVRKERAFHDGVVALWMSQFLKRNPYINATVMARLLTDNEIPTPMQHMDAAFGRDVRDGQWNHVSVRAIADRMDIELAGKRA